MRRDTSLYRVLHFKSRLEMEADVCWVAMLKRSVDKHYPFLVLTNRAAPLDGLRASFSSTRAMPLTIIRCSLGVCSKRQPPEPTSSRSGAPSAPIGERLRFLLRCDREPRLCPARLRNRRPPGERVPHR